MLRLAVIALGCASIVACTHDFGAFDPGADPGPDAASDSKVGGDGGEVGGADSRVATDSGSADSAPLDTAVPDTAVAPDTTTTCTEPGALGFDGHCYFPIAADTWDAAKAKCATFGAHLVTITSAGEQAFVETIKNGRRWIGLQRPAAAPATPDSYAWVTGESTAYQHWGPGQPAGTGECGDLTKSGSWSDQDCTNAEVGICEHD